MERKLASIRQVEDVIKHPKADKLDICTIDGWNVIVPIGEIKIGETIVFVEIDSFLPLDERFQKHVFLSVYKKKWNGTEGYLIFTRKVRDELTQGVIFPLNILGDLVDISILNIGDDVTKLLNITKYDPENSTNETNNSNTNDSACYLSFPPFIPKTDAKRVQNLTKYFNDMRHINKFIVTEKLDGTSATFYKRNEHFGACTRNFEVDKSHEKGAASVYWKMAEALNLEEKLKSIKQNVALQGEIIGPNIQKNIYGLSECTVKFFNAFDIDTQSHLNWTDFKNLLKELVLESVPVLNEDFELPETARKLVSNATGISQLKNDVYREGLVLRTSDKSISFKAISNDFLLNDEDNDSGADNINKKETKKQQKDKQKKKK